MKNQMENEMSTKTQLEEITTIFASELKRGVLAKTIKARLINNGTNAVLAEKLVRIAELKTA